MDPAIKLPPAPYQQPVLDPNIAGNRVSGEWLRWLNLVKERAEAAAFETGGGDVGVPGTLSVGGNAGITGALFVGGGASIGGPLVAPSLTATGTVSGGTATFSSDGPHTFGTALLTNAATRAYLGFEEQAGSGHPWEIGIRPLQNPFSGVDGTWEFALWDKPTSDPVRAFFPALRLGWSSFLSAYVVLPHAGYGGHLGFPEPVGSSADRWGSVNSGSGYYERGRLALMGDWTPYTPVWSSTGVAVALGNGSIIGRYMKVGHSTFYEIALTIGSTTTFGTGVYLFSYPSTRRNDSFQNVAIGNWFAQDVSAGALYMGPMIGNTTQVEPVVTNAAGLATGIGPTVPFTWANGDFIEISGMYEEA